MASYVDKDNVCFTSESVVKTLEGVKHGCVEESTFLKISSSDLKYGTLFVLSHRLFPTCVPFAPAKVCQQSSEDLVHFMHRSSLFLILKSTQTIEQIVKQR